MSTFNSPTQINFAAIVLSLQHYLLRVVPVRIEKSWKSAQKSKV